jgi:hypothetical protein
MSQLSNNHVLIDDESIKLELMKSEPGDHIRLKGMLAEYSNAGSGFFRSTSTTRDDSGDGACETIFLTDFGIVKKANPLLRLSYSIAKWIAITSLVGVVILFFAAPHRARYA